MYVERLLQINVATLVALASLLVGMGRQSTLMPLGMMIAAMLSVWLTDVKGWFSLSRMVAGLASIAALAVSLSWPVEWEKVPLITAVADFLVYVQVIHLFQRKQPRIYWALIRFSVLQVVVAALLVQGAFFGMLLVVYLLTALGAVVLLFLHCERIRHPGSAGLPPAQSAPRWPLAGQVAQFASPPPGPIRVQRELFRQLLRIGVATIALSVPVFLTVPRIGQSAWRGVGMAPRHVVGFSDRIALGELGRVIQSPEEVLQIRFAAESGKERYWVHGEVYLRGAVVTEYQNGQWSNRPGRSRDLPDLLALPPRPIGRPVVRQWIHVEPMFREELFCVWPFAALATGARDPRLQFDRLTGRLSRKSDYKFVEFEFELATTAFEGGVQSLLYPNEEPLSDLDLADLLQMPGEPGRSALPSLVDLAGRWTAVMRFPAEDRANRARFLEGRLRDSGEFAYSLKGQGRDPKIDPIEDFVSNNPRGHCEYFATALVLMLRSQRIPARMVIGYRTGEWNDLGGFFQVRQLHAHTWVEAYLRPGDLPARLAKDPEWAGGAWLRLDATPASGASEIAGAWRHGVGRALDWLDFLWSHYVLDMDRSRQHEAIYAPALETLQQLGKTLTDAGWWKERFGKLTQALGLSGRGEGGAASVLRLIEVWVLAMLLLLAIGYGAHRFLLVPALEALSGRPRRAARRAPVRVEFYRRFEAVLARRGLVRPASRTQREFAVRAGQELAQRAGDSRLALLPVRVAEAFYRVRFGGAILDKQEREAVEQALTQLERAPRANTH